MNKLPRKSILLFSLLLLFVGVSAYLLLNDRVNITGRATDIPFNNVSEEHDVPSGIDDAKIQVTIASETVSAYENELIRTILLLRQASKNEDVVKIAKKYILLEDNLSDTIHNNVWRKVSNCVYIKCEETNYIDLIQSIVSHDLSIDANKKIHYLINTIYLWRGQNEALFSRSLTITNELFEEEPKKTKDAWEEIISCNGCSQIHEKTISLIDIIIK